MQPVGLPAAGKSAMATHLLAKTHHADFEGVENTWTMRVFVAGQIYEHEDSRCMFCLGDETFGVVGWPMKKRLVGGGVVFFPVATARCEWKIVISSM